MTKATKNSILREYIALTKPGIIRGNLLMAAAGYLLAANGHIDLITFAALLVGTSLIIAAACICNNYIDRDIDVLMERTKMRASVSGTIPVGRGISLAMVLLTLGSLTLGLLTNLLTLSLGLTGFVMYVFVYGYWKRRSWYGTHIGTISGAIPPVAGYAAATNQLNGTALALFLILVFWQMPHFFSIALYRLKEYQAASVPVLPAVHGIAITKKQTIGYVIGYGVVSELLAYFTPMSLSYIIIMGLLVTYWLGQGLRHWKTKDGVEWGRYMFFISLIALLTQSVLLMANSFLP